MAKKIATGGTNLVVIDIPVGQHTKGTTLQEGRNPAANMRKTYLYNQ